MGALDRRYAGDDNPSTRFDTLPYVPMTTSESDALLAGLEDRLPPAFRVLRVLAVLEEVLVQVHRECYRPADCLSSI